MMLEPNVSFEYYALLQTLGLILHLDAGKTWSISTQYNTFKEATTATLNILPSLPIIITLPFGAV
jgi:hypothetical protein